MKWQWFVGGKKMFWVSIIVMVIFVVGFVGTYILDPVTTFIMKKSKLDNTSIKNISEQYVKKLRNRNR